MSVSDWISWRLFRFVHGNNLVYNACWEDPRVDRAALQIGAEDELLVITSAGCNVLDYVLAGPRRVFAVDMNWRQNALLELKLAGIRRLEFEDFFRYFGRGVFSSASRVYRQALRGELSAPARAYWDRWITFFDGRRGSFYFRGAAGAFARIVNWYLDHGVKLRPSIARMLEATSLPEQRRIYESEIKDKLWSSFARFAMSRDGALAMVGVPRAQRRQIESQHPGGIANYIRARLDEVFTELPLADNYFWRVYMTGEYSSECCPEYLRADNFQRLKSGLVDRIAIHTDTVQGFLEKHEAPISRFVLLDHMDWLSDRFFSRLEDEWRAILNRAAAGARLIWRSGGMQTDYLDRVEVPHDGRRRPLGELLCYQQALARELHAVDRVHTYGSFYIADLTR